MTVDEIIQTLKLSPHPEGAYYRETYRSPLSLPDLEGFSGPRSCSTLLAQFSLHSDIIKSFCLKE